MKNLIDRLRSREAVKAANRSSTIREQQTRAILLQTAGLTHYEQGSYDTAASYLKSSLSMWTALGDLQAEQRLFRWLGLCYWNLGEIQASHRCYQEASTLIKVLDSVPCRLAAEN